MKEFTYTIKDKLGIHARPAGMLVKVAEKYECEINILHNEKLANAKKIFSVMSLGIHEGDKVRITALGSDEIKAIEEIKKFFEENL